MTEDPITWRRFRDLADAVSQEGQPKVCMKHPKAVWHDEKECPCCKAEREFMQLTKHMEV